MISRRKPSQRIRRVTTRDKKRGNKPQQNVLRENVAKWLFGMIYGTDEGARKRISQLLKIKGVK